MSPTTLTFTELHDQLTELITNIEALASTTRVRADHIAITRLHTQAVAIRNSL